MVCLVVHDPSGQGEGMGLTDMRRYLKADRHRSRTADHPFPHTSTVTETVPARSIRSCASRSLCSLFHDMLFERTGSRNAARNLVAADGRPARPRPGQTPRRTGQYIPAGQCRIALSEAALSATAGAGQVTLVPFDD